MSTERGGGGQSLPHFPTATTPTGSPHPWTSPSSPPLDLNPTGVCSVSACHPTWGHPHRHLVPPSGQHRPRLRDREAQCTGPGTAQEGVPGSPSRDGQVAAPTASASPTPQEHGGPRPSSPAAQHDDAACLGVDSAVVAVCPDTCEGGQQPVTPGGRWGQAARTATRQVGRR